MTPVVNRSTRTRSSSMSESPRKIHWSAHVVSTKNQRSGKKNFKVCIKVGKKLLSTVSTPKVSEITTYLRKQEKLKQIDRCAIRSFNTSVARLKSQALADGQLVMPRRPSTSNSKSCRRNRKRKLRIVKNRKNIRPSTAGDISKSRGISFKRYANQGNVSVSPTALNSYAKCSDFHDSMAEFGWTFLSDDHNFSKPLDAAFSYVPETFDLSTSWGRENFLTAYMKTVPQKISLSFVENPAACRMLHGDATVVNCIKNCWEKLLSASSNQKVSLESLETCPEIEMLVAQTVSLSNSRKFTKYLEGCNTYQLRCEVSFVLTQLFKLNPRSFLNIQKNSWVVESVDDDDDDGRIHTRNSVFTKGGYIMKDVKEIMNMGKFNCRARRSIESPLKLKGVGGSSSLFTINVWSLCACQAQEIVLFAFDTPYVTEFPSRVSVEKMMGVVKSKTLSKTVKNSPFFITAEQLCQHILNESSNDFICNVTSSNNFYNNLNASTLFEYHFWPQIMAAIRMAVQRPAVQHYNRSYCFFDFRFAIDSNLMLWLIHCRRTEPNINIPNRSTLVSELIGLSIDGIGDQAYETFPFVGRQIDKQKDRPEISGNWREIARQVVPANVPDMMTTHVEIEYMWRSKLASCIIQKIVRGYLARKKITEKQRGR